MTARGASPFFIYPLDKSPGSCDNISKDWQPRDETALDMYCIYVTSSTTQKENGYGKRKNVRSNSDTRS